MEKKVIGLNMDMDLVKYLTERHLRFQLDTGRRMSFSKYLCGILETYRQKAEPRLEGPADA